MRIDVPIIKQETPTDCSPTCLKMVASYFGKEVSIEKIRELCIPDVSGVVWTLGLVRASLELGFKSEFYSLILGVDENLFELDFYKKNMDQAEKVKKKVSFFISESKSKGGKLFEKSLELKELLSFISKDKLIILNLDWKVVDQKLKYSTIHSIVLTGFDDDFVYVNEPGYGVKDFKIKRDIFDKARKAKGTDEDLLIISKN